MHAVTDEPDGMRSVRQREIVDSSPLKRRLVLEKAGERLSVEGVDVSNS